MPHYNFDQDHQIILNKLSEAGISFKDKIIYVTGAAGFLGSWISEILCKQGAIVYGFDDLSSGLEENFHLLSKMSNFHFIKHDVGPPFMPGGRSSAGMRIPELDHIDYILHMASRASPFEFEKYPLHIIRTNTMGNFNCLEIARKFGATHLFTSTSEVYGNPPPEHVPSPETYNGNVNPNGPRACYDESKRLGETIVLNFSRLYDVDVKIIRIFNTYGPRIRYGEQFGRVVPNFIHQALYNEEITVFGEGKQTRSFTFVTDEITGILKVLYIPEARGMPINVGNDKEYTMVELAQMVIKFTNSKSKIKFLPLPQDDPERRRPVLDRARKILNWEPFTPVQEGIKKTILWFKDQWNLA